jgi:cysteine synthase
VARRMGPGKRVITIVPDSAERYLSKKIFDV